MNLNSVIPVKTGTTDPSLYGVAGAAFDFRIFSRRSERLGNAGSANQARYEIRHKSPPADPFSHKGLTDYATLFAALPKSVGNSGEQPPLRPRSKQRRNTSTLSLNGAERAARDLPPDASFAALSEPNAAAPKLAIHAYDGAIASHSLFARSERHARLRSRPPPFKSINIQLYPPFGAGFINKEDDRLVFRRASAPIAPQPRGIRRGLSCRWR